jgi:hypothetical protein
VARVIEANLEAPRDRLLAAVGAFAAPLADAAHE